MTTDAYLELSRHWLRQHRFGHLSAIAGWDRAAMMPTKGNEARAQALAEMDALLHRMGTEPWLAERLTQAEQEPLDDTQRANLREMRREWESANALPAALVEAKSLAASRCEHAWQTQRPAGDWAGFLVNLEEVLRLAREEAARRGEASGLAPYDALMDVYEPGMRSATVDRLFGDLQTWLPGLVRQALDRQSRETVVAPTGPFPKSAQRGLSLDVMRLLGFDFDAGRLDESAHPFSGGVPEDTRLTTRYREDDFLQSLTGTIHETGHARYEQNLPRDWLGQPVSRARSMGIHESQSLSFEMQLGQSAGFVGLLEPLLERHLGTQAAFEAANVQRLLTRVRADFIRVDADELTYPAHVILRYGIEKRLIEGELEARDIPAAWDEGMMSLLGVDTRRQLQERLHAGRALERQPVRLLPLLHPRRDVRRPVVRHDPAADARPGSTHRRRRSVRRLRLASRERLAAGQPLDDRRAGRACHRRSAESGALPTPSRDALPQRAERELSAS